MISLESVEVGACGTTIFRKQVGQLIFPPLVLESAVMCWPQTGHANLNSLIRFAPTIPHPPCLHNSFFASNIRITHSFSPQSALVVFPAWPARSQAYPTAFHIEPRASVRSARGLPPLLFFLFRAQSSPLVSHVTFLRIHRTFGLC